MTVLHTLIHRGLWLLLFPALLGAAACSGNGSDAGPTETPAVAATPAPDAKAAEQVFQTFVEAVGTEDLLTAWSLYAASVPGNIDEYRGEMGCPYAAFREEFTKMRHLFSQTAPFEVIASYLEKPGSVIIELELRAANGSGFLATLQRVEPYEPYRLHFLNSGQVAVVPGQPDPLPSPEYPQGYCGIWTGPR